MLQKEMEIIGKVTKQKKDTKVERFFRCLNIVYYSYFFLLLQGAFVNTAATAQTVREGLQTT